MPVQVPSVAICKVCKNPLFGASKSFCPECGRDFDPSDSATFERQNVMNQVYWMQPPYWFMSLLALGMTFLVVSDASMPGPSSLIICILPLFGLFVIADWLMRIYYVSPLKRRSSSFDARRPRRSRWHWAILPFCIALVASTINRDWPLQIRFRLSKSAFDAKATAMRSGQIPRIENQWIGWYRIQSGYLNQRDGVVYFDTGRYGVGMFAGRSGFVHFYPAGASLGPQSREHLDGGWFTFR